MIKCKHFPACGGCQFQSLSDSDEELGKRNAFIRTLARHGVNTEIGGFISSPLHSRRRATLSGKRTKKGAILGFHETKSHNIVDMQMCIILREKIFNLRPYLKEMMPILGSRSSQVKFHITELHFGFDIEIENAKQVEPPELATIAEIAERAHIQRILLNNEQIYFAGSAQIEIGNLLIDAPPHPFLQATKDAEIALRRLAHQAVSEAKNIADLFSGIGTFSYGIKANVEAFEGNGQMCGAIQNNINRLGLHNIKAEQRDLFRDPIPPSELAVFDAVIIDPPRSGAKAQCEALAESSVKTIAFISCDPSTFARDAKTLMDGGYDMSAVTLIDQFRFSAHIECFAVFEKLS